tara:strand:+ start:10055 stop:10330 length:276 start_codon:yes stop_codon:yes gene_type:complete
MEQNKLIAEFMEVHQIMHDGYSEYDFDDNTLDVLHEEELQYHSSWDWLMPVIDKCYQEHMSKRISDAVMTCDIDTTYKAVVEFIKEYNNYN